LNPGASQAPFSWMWKACSPGEIPETFAFTSTPFGIWVSVAVPTRSPCGSTRVTSALRACRTAAWVSCAVTGVSAPSQRSRAPAAILSGRVMASSPRPE
jgi:hypothetical protein